ncbi:Phage-related baseplate assembly protein [Planctomycetes bacterium Pan216]|uniref:Phage-related baseplate assembly protein n=1 Tax=Kolteria novifilia TaxID=2527975 RepID=A0A518B115_9BACT|nr:Phage-related baseplate assembly protein [Planctomycetes bacterium Pan216]
MVHSQTVELSLATPLKESGPTVYGFEGREAVSELFAYKLYLHTPTSEYLSSDKLLGQLASLSFTIDRQSTRRVHGMIDELSHVGGDARYEYYEAGLVPPVALLDLGRGYRIFAEKTFEQIVKESLEGYPVRFRLSEKHYPLDHSVRYAESTWNHVRRVAEDEGCHWYFEHDADWAPGQCGLTFADVMGQSPPIPGATPIPLRLEGTEPHINRWRTRQRLTARKVKTNDYHHEMPDADLSHTERFASPVRVGSRVATLDHPALKGCCLDVREPFAHQFREIARDGHHDPEGLDGLFEDKSRRTRILFERQLGQAIESRGRTNFSGMIPGHTFELSDAGSESGRYWIVQVKHGVRIPLADSSRVEASSYTARIRCIPAELPYRPPATASRHRVAGAAIGNVVASDHEEVTVNDYAAVKVRFPWDSDEGKNAVWARHRFARAGKGHGDIHLPHKEHEVLCVHEEGNPEHYYVLGSLPSVRHVPPESREVHRNVQGYWGQSLEQDRTSAHQLSFDRRDEGEKLAWRSEHDARISSESDHHIASDYAVINVGYATAESADDGSGSGGSSSGSGNHTLDVMGNFFESVWGGFTRQVLGDSNCRVKGFATFNSLIHTSLMDAPTIVIAAAVFHIHMVHNRFIIGIGRLDVSWGLAYWRFHFTKSSYKLWAARYMRKVAYMSIAIAQTDVFAATVNYAGAWFKSNPMKLRNRMLEIRKENLRSDSASMRLHTTAVYHA